MSQIYKLKITNFRGIKNFEQIFPANFICLVGRGDTGKSTILDAINLVLSSSWTHTFYDNDFYQSKTVIPICIEVTIKNPPGVLLSEQKYFMYLRGLDIKDGKVYDEINDDHEPVLTLQLKVCEDLEPQWNVITDRDLEPKAITASDRAKFNVFFVSDYIDRHFNWSKGSPLYSILKAENPQIEQNDTILIEALRIAKEKIDSAEFTQFNLVVKKVKANAALLGADISNAINSIDFRDIVIKDGKISLHEETVPFRLKGKGSKRLISTAIQATIAGNSGILLIDEIEQGLEPDRAQHFVNILKSNNKGQIFITTHSRNILVELDTVNLFRMIKNGTKLVEFPKDLQGLLRANPEGFFANKVIIAEGPTEIGICKAFNEFRVINGKMNMSYRGIVVVDGKGGNMFKYSDGFHNLNFDVVLLCDSDINGNDKKANDNEKVRIRNLGIRVFDWEEGESSEEAILKVISYFNVKIAFNLAASYFSEKNAIDLIEAKKQLWDSVKSNFGLGCPENLEAALDSVKLRKAIGIVIKKKGCFKNQNNGHEFGKILFSDYKEMNDSSKIKQNFEAISIWIDSNGS
jgi:putative ATP-dependent endonuclease of the OLD family